MGPAATGAAVVFSVYNVATAPPGHRVEAVVVEGTTWAGATVGAGMGAKVGATVGTFIAPGLGTTIGTAGGAIIGGGVGAWTGGKVGERLVTGPPPRPAPVDMNSMTRATIRLY